MSEFESFRCMISSEDSKEEGPGFCAYPNCWLEECPHKQARDRLAEAEKVLKAWKEYPTFYLDDYSAKVLRTCAFELEAVLHGKSYETDDEYHFKEEAEG